MHSTSESLLLKLKKSGTEEPWNRFVKLYTPLLFFWARRIGLQVSDASDLVQDVLGIVFQKLPYWQYDREKSFRGWLRTITLNRHRELARKQKLKLEAGGSAIQSVADHQNAESTWDLNYARQLVASAVESMKDDFHRSTWRALKELMTTGDSVAEIARKNNVSVWTLYAAKTRLINRLRAELEGLL